MARGALDSEKVGSLQGEQGFLSLWLPEPLPAPEGGIGGCPGGQANRGVRGPGLVGPPRPLCWTLPWAQSEA